MILPPVVVLDPVSGETDYEWVPFEQYGGDLVQSAIDYDLADAFPWTSYSIENLIYEAGTIYNQALQRVDTQMDDGSRIILSIVYNGNPRFEGSARISETYTSLDALGRTLSLDVKNLSPNPSVRFESFFAFVQQSVVYDAASGRIDYISTLHHDRRRESIDYDVTTNQRDFVSVIYADGRTLAEDYNASNGVLDYRRVTGVDGSALDEDYDSLGRLDYAVERLADGRMRVTDYDVANQHDWASYSILYAVSGQIESVTVL